jgi:type II secretory pathway pseudopilin PulG
MVELLTVIAVIGILAALILTAVSKAIVQGKVTKAKTEMAGLVQAVHAYRAAYNSYPVSSGVISAATAARDDFTYGGTALAGILGPGNWSTNNSEVIAILMDLENDGYGNPTVNKGHLKNPQQHKFLDATMVSDPTLPGVGPDLVYRDPWGNPYIISMDLNYDDKCKDAFYCLKSVSQQLNQTGFNGLVNSVDAGGNGDDFLFSGDVMVWSLGPDKQADKNQPANAPPNQDNVLSWK